MSVWLQGGYPVHLFLDKISEHWICGICNNVIRSSVSTKCGHVFCFSCIRVFVERYGTCPFNCGPADMAHLNLVPGIDQEIEAQFIRCPRYKFGCHRILRVGDLILHEKVCVNTPSPADHGIKKRRINIKINSRPGEPLGFHVSGGEKLSVSNVVKGLPADRAGLRAGDRILEVNSQSVSHWTHQDAVDLIRRSTSPVVISVERAQDTRTHVYEEIDSGRSLAHQQSRASDRDSGMGRSEFSASSQLLSRGAHMEGSRSPSKGESPGPKGPLRSGGVVRSADQHTPLPSFDRNQDSRMSVRTESEMMKKSRKIRVRKPSLDTIMQDKGEDQIMDITLHRSIGTRLGITLGFDQNKKSSKLYVMSLLPDGIAAKDGRLLEGDVIIKINGFEVHDTEEALMMFLEQDPSITITVARSKKATNGSSMRRVDSCGSLDSHTYKSISQESGRDAHHTQNPNKLDRQSYQTSNVPIMRVFSPQEGRSPLRHFAPHSSHGNNMSRGSPRRVARKKDYYPVNLRSQQTPPRTSPHVFQHTPSNAYTQLTTPPHVMHLRATSAPETQV